MPLKNLYRSQVVQLGQHLGLPSEILQRTPNPDMVPGVTDKYMSYLELDATMVDMVLWGLENGMEDHSISEQLNLPQEKVREIREVTILTDQLRNPSLAPAFE